MHAHEDILIELILNRFADVENKATDKNFGMNKKQSMEAWNVIQIEFEKKTKVTTFDFVSMNSI